MGVAAPNELAGGLQVDDLKAVPAAKASALGEKTTLPGIAEWSQGVGGGFSAINGKIGARSILPVGIFAEFCGSLTESKYWDLPCSETLFFDNRCGRGLTDVMKTSVAWEGPCMWLAPRHMR